MMSRAFFRSRSLTQCKTSIFSIILCQSGQNSRNPYGSASAAATTDALDAYSKLHFAISIHALPETLMLVDPELLRFCKFDQQTCLEALVAALNQLKHRAFENEKATVDPAALNLWFFSKQFDIPIFDLELTVA
jgi:hypothetical protein